MMFFFFQFLVTNIDLKYFLIFLRINFKSIFAIILFYFTYLWLINLINVI